MSDYHALYEVGETIRAVLWQEIQADAEVKAYFNNDENNISLESPFDLENNNSVRLSIYLYRIVEDANSKNQFPVAGNGGRLRKPPLTLDLYYLVTPLVGEPRERQIVLGKVMQVLYDRSILEGSDLVGSLGASGEELRVLLNPVTLEETTRVWTALEMSYRLSVCYMARVALIDSRREQALQPVIRKIDKYGQY